MSKRGRGTGHLYEKWGSYYGRWRTLDGRNVNRIVGPVRTPGSADGLPRVMSETCIVVDVPPEVAGLERIRVTVAVGRTASQPPAFTLL